MKPPTLIACVGMLAAVFSISAAPPVAAGPECAQPTIQTLISAESAVSRPVIASPAEYGLSNVYSQIEQATKPQFTYAEAGPQYAGAFEALLPAGSPPPVRAVSAYPSDDIPDSDTRDWGGSSHTEVTAISASASSSGAKEMGVGGATSESSRSWATSIVECDVVTLIAGWQASNVVFAPGVTADQIGETLTLVVGPNGSSAQTDVTLVGVAGAQGVPLEGRPTDPFTDPVREGGGPRLEAGEPRTSADEQGASASGGGFNFLLTDPSTGQGAGYRIGSLNADIKVLGALEFDRPVVAGSDGGGDTGSTPVLGPDADAASSAVAVAGSAPPPSPVAIATARGVLTDTVLSSVTVTTRSWFWLYASLATLLNVGGAAVTSRAWRRWFPTLDWLVRHGDRLRSRFSTVYLRW